MTIAVVIPARNEQATIRGVAGRALAHCPWVIVVDDASTDGTGGRLDGLPVRVLRNDCPRGKGGALWRGMQEALAGGAEAVVTLDGDGQHAPEDIPLLLAKAARRPGGIVIGARLIGREGAPGLRRFANAFADFWLSWASGQRLRDSQSGFRVYPAALLRGLAIPCGPERGFVFENEVLIEAARRGHFVTEVPIRSLYPAHARPSYYRPSLDTWRITGMVAWKLLSRGLFLRGLWRGVLVPRLGHSLGRSGLGG